MTPTNQSTTEPVPAATLNALAIVSMLGEPADANAATRQFDGRPVLAATIERILAADVANAVVVVAWDDQTQAIRDAIGDEAAVIESIGPRRAMPWLDGVSAALRWADGWRGALLGATEFDRGFEIQSVQRMLSEHGANAALLVSPAAAFVEPATLRALAERLESDPEQPYAFAAGPVGAVAMLVRQGQLAELERGRRGPGSLLTYHPDRPVHDPLAKQFAVPVPSRVARTLTRVAPDSARGVRRLSLTQATAASGLETLVGELEADRSLDPLPREVVLDITTRRATKPIWTLHSRETLGPIDLPLATAEQLFAEIARVDRHTRITFSGIGDPLMHPEFCELIIAARTAGLDTLHVETDLLVDDQGVSETLTSGAIDVVSFHLPAVMRETYQAVMGADRIGDVITNVQRLVAMRSARGTGVPIFVPTFVKCVANFAQMEAWYDQWIRALGVAVIVPATDLAGRIPNVSNDDLTPPMRRPCRRLSNRITIRADGSIMPCEEATCASHAVGHLNASSLQTAWTDGLAMLRSLHEERRWDESDLCRTCRMWDRP